MRKVSLIFVILISLATLALGLLWQQVQSLAVTQTSFGTVALIVIYGLLLIFALLGLGRILVRLASVASNGEPGEQRELEK